MKKIIDGTIIIFVLTLIVYLSSYFYQMTYFVNLGVPTKMIQPSIEGSIPPIFLIIIYTIFCVYISFFINNIIMKKTRISLYVLTVMVLIFITLSLLRIFINDFNFSIIYLMTLHCFSSTLIIYFNKTLKFNKEIKKESKKNNSVVKNLITFTILFQYLIVFFIIISTILIPMDFAKKHAREETWFLTTYINDDCYLFFEPNKNYYVAVKLDKEKKKTQNTVHIIHKNTSVEVHIESLGKLNN